MSAASATNTPFPLARELKPRGLTRYAGISRAAQLLGCNRTHLWHVLQGNRTSPSLVVRYQQLVGSGALDENKGGKAQ